MNKFIFLQTDKKTMKLLISDKNKDLFLISYLILLLFPALFINLGLMPFILDEATRANVALEMLFSGDYIVPTINGELYYNKPPLFNWIQIIFVRLIDSDSEFVFRLPVVISLLLFSLSIYKTLKTDLGRGVAFFTALAVLTSGRILFYDSFKGLIDISFSWLIYLLFWAVYYFGSRKKYLKLFLSAYLFASLAFMMKALPSLVFLGITLLVWFISTKEFKKLFSWQHLAGFGLLLLLVGGYLFIYNLQNPLSNYMDTLWSESSKRTFLDNNLWESLRHVFLFPFQFLYYFVPWTVLIILLFWKENRRIVFENKITRYFFLIFIANILIYWVSPAIYARYLFMFLPIFFSILFYVLSLNENENYVKYFFKPFFLLISSLLFLFILSIPFITEPAEIEHFWLKYLFSLGLFLPTLFLIKSKFQNYILISIGVLLIVRIVFNIYVLPHRLHNSSYLNQKNGAIMVGTLSKSNDLFVLSETRIHHSSSFYIMRERRDILGYTDGMNDKSDLYIIEKEKRGEYPPHTVLYEFETRIKATKLCLVKLE